MSAQNQIDELHGKLAEMEGDLSSVLITFQKLFDALGIDLSTISDTAAGDNVIGAITSVISKVPMKLMSPTFNKGVFQEVGQLQPLLKKYQYLIPEKQNG